VNVAHNIVNGYCTICRQSHGDIATKVLPCDGEGGVFLLRDKNGNPIKWTDEVQKALSTPGVYGPDGKEYNP
jgi:hypothetical protein